MLSRKPFYTVPAIALALGLAMAGPAAAGTLDRAPQEAWATPLSDTEMSEMRGGFRGLAVTTFISIENLQNDLDGSVDLLTDPPTVTSTADGQTQVSASVSNLVGPSGVFQFVQVPGNFNVVNANLTVQIFVDQLPDGVSVLGF